ncbi:MAG: hypothetical protein WA738_11845 [Candidatus Angelobacter sp.]
MSGFRSISVDPAICAAVRSTLKSPQYAILAHREPAAGYGPCRSYLKQFHVGAEDRILFNL